MCILMVDTQLLKSRYSQFSVFFTPLLSKSTSLRSSTDRCDGWSLPSFFSFSPFGACFHLIELTNLFQAL